MVGQAGSCESVNEIYFFTMKVYSRSGKEIGTRVGIVQAKNSLEAQEVAWNLFGDDYCAGCKVWLIDGREDCYTVYYNN